MDIARRKGWRNSAIKKLIGDGKKIPSVEELYQAALIRDDHYTSYFIAFCAGFSERLVTRAVEIVAGK